MCARYAFFRGRVVKDDFGDTPLPDLEPRWNIAPMQMAPIILPSDGRWDMRLMRWGLVPEWADESIATKTINARSETAADKPSFREAWRHRRCLIPANGYFEWKEAKAPYFVHHADSDVLYMAGLWEEKGDLKTFTVLTCEPNETMARLHDRMPVILSLEAGKAWMEGPFELGPCPDEWLAMHPVTPRMGKVTLDEPSLVEPVDPQPSQGSLF